MRLRIFAALLSIVLFSLIVLCSKLYGERFGEPVEPAPDFLLESINGRRIEKRDFRGRKFGMIFFRSDCGYCIEELAQLDRLLPGLSSPLELLIVSLDGDGKAAAAPIYFPSPRTLAGYRVTATPMLFLIDENGALRYRQAGLRSDEFMTLVFERFVRGEELTASSLRAAYKTIKRAPKNAGAGKD